MQEIITFWVSAFVMGTGSVILIYLGGVYGKI